MRLVAEKRLRIGLEAFGATRAANTVGGDFYDILPRPDGRVVIALGDVALALPGSIGTFAEIVLLWNANFITTFSGDSPTPLLAVGPVWADLLPRLEAALETESGHVEWVEGIDDAIQWLSLRP